MNIKENMSLNDKVFNNRPSAHRGLWADTEVIGSYDDVIYNPNGKSSFKEELFHTRNIVPLGGVSYVMQSVFAIPETQISIPSMHYDLGIGLGDSPNPTETFLVPGGSRTIVRRSSNAVFLFGVGITGAGESDITVYTPDYREKSIGLTKVNSDGLQVTGTMLPFRYTADSLNSTEKSQYFGKKTEMDGTVGYYLKTFEAVPTIKHIWKTSDDNDNETLVASEEAWTNAAGMNTVETFTEIVLKVGKHDIKEWFNKLEQEDRARINTIALFSGEYVKDPNDLTDPGDFRDVKLFSKLCINPEYLTLSKDLNIIYRVYGA